MKKLDINCLPSVAWPWQTFSHLMEKETKNSALYWHRYIPSLFLV